LVARKFEENPKKIKKIRNSWLQKKKKKGLQLGRFAWRFLGGVTFEDFEGSK
jgi:hypothetical protein